MKQEHNSRAEKAGQTQIAPPGAASPESNGKANDGQKPPWHYKVERWTFMPVKATTEWSHEQDMEEYETRFGKSENPLRDTRIRVERNLDDLHRVLTSGIVYFLEKSGVYRLAPVAGLTLRDKVEVVYGVAPNTSDSDYVLRFTTTLAGILWLESEHRRVLAQRDRQPWLYPLYHLADCIATATSELEEALSCEHDDYDKERVEDEESEDGIPEENRPTGRW